MENQNFEDLNELSGEASVKSAPKYELPSLKLNGNTGRFILSRKDETTGLYQEEDLGTNISGTILKIRRTFGSFTKKENLYTNEHNSYKDKISLFQVQKDTSGKRTIQKIDDGFIAELREKYQLLKMKQIIYFLLEPTKEVVKLTIKGKGLGNLFEYFKEFKGDKHLFQYVTEIGQIKEEGELGDYYATTFKMGKEIKDLTLVAEKIRDVAKKIADVEAYYTEKSMSFEEQLDKKMGDGQNKFRKRDTSIPTIDINEDMVDEEEEPMPKKFTFPKDKPEEDIDVSKIPF